MRRKDSIRLLMCTMGIMGIGMAAFSFDNKADINEKDIPVISDNSSTEEYAQNKDSQTQEAVVTHIPTPSPVPNVLVRNTSSKLSELIKAYYKATLDSSSSYEGILTRPETADPEKIYLMTEYIKEYHDIKCYTKKGIGVIDYVVYVTYNIELPTIDTYAMSMDEFYVCVDDEGDMLIFSGELDEETKAYITGLREEEDVEKLLDEVNTIFSEQVESDEQLKEFYLKLTAASGNPADSDESE